MTMQKNSATRILILFITLFFIVNQLTAQQTAHLWDNLPKVILPSFKLDTFRITDYGASGDGQTMNTQAINKAILECSERGGGVVLVPKGFWLTGPIYLKSNVNLHLQANALLQFSSNFEDYRIIKGNYEGKPSARNESPISGTNLQNIAITGSGVIDGNGQAWRMVGRGELTEREWKTKIASGGLVSEDGKTWFPSVKTKRAHEQKRSVLLSDAGDLANFNDIKDYLRPNMVVLTSCQKVLLEGVTFRNSPAWNLHPLMCENVTIRNIVVYNPDYAQNGDGVDIESCMSVLIEDSVFDVGDDAICIKSGKDEEGRKRNMPTQNVIVRRNVVYAGHGGFVVGSEMSGGAKNLFVEDCTFIGTDKGLRFKSTRGRGGIVENVNIRNINMSNIGNEAIYFDMYYWTKPPQDNEPQAVPEVSEETPRFRNIVIDGVNCSGAQMGIFVRGLPEMPIENLVLKNINIRSASGIYLKDVKGSKFGVIRLNTEDENGKTIYMENVGDLDFHELTIDSTHEPRYELSGSNNGPIEMSATNIKKQDFQFFHGATGAVIKW